MRLPCRLDFCNGELTLAYSHQHLQFISIQSYELEIPNINEYHGWILQIITCKETAGIEPFFSQVVVCGAGLAGLPGRENPSSLLIDYGPCMTGDNSWLWMIIIDGDYWGEMIDWRGLLMTWRPVYFKWIPAFRRSGWWLPIFANVEIQLPFSLRGYKTYIC